MSHIVVTGAAGFIGSHVVESLLSRGHSVTGVDAFTDTYSAAIKHDNIGQALASSQFRLVQGVVGAYDLAAELEGADAVIHLAGEPGVRRSWGPMFTSYLARNIHSTQAALEACVQAGTSRFVLASSSSVYGDAAEGTLREDAPQTPLNPYGVTKLAAERLCDTYAYAFGIEPISLRYFTAYGPRQRPDMALYNFIDAALSERPMGIFGDGLQRRDLTFVRDIADATVRAAFITRRSPTVINIAAGLAVSMVDLANAAAELVGARPAIEFLPPTRGEVQSNAGDNTLAQTLLEWRPSTNLSEGIRAQIEWMTHTQGGY